MINVSELLAAPYLPGNYFAPDAYVQGDYESGLIENRVGARLLAMPDTLLQALYAGLAEEVGPSAGMVLFQCGYWWGKSFYRRFQAEVSDYYQQPLAQMEMAAFLQCFKQCWRTHGWGDVEVDLDYSAQGFLVVKLQHSAFAQASPDLNRPSCFTEAGLLSAFFSQLTGRDLHCIQTACETLGDDCNFFVLGLRDRVKMAEAWLEEAHDHVTVMERLCQSQPLS
ncbi:4-vinyl reductase [Synechococcales cyanobacterium C]|uniref:4-vinyl reductase n=1 Tax=Petrachloros mirabilis ULC683 TaxID=2781853 RepID=A0A8K2A131_9CYAN|nr:V4R domain-containing protein [Petrachloros mirabilis]NCJ07673.1 4-vinyl reductase [Petrachloros mirabilis ULC683]